MILIGVLAVALGGVLYFQFGRSVATEPQSAAQLTTVSQPRTTNAKPSSTSDGSPVPTAAAPKQVLALGNWQPPDLASVIQYDPFALPASFPQPPPTGPDGQLAQAEANVLQDESTLRAALETERKQTQSELEGLRRQGVHVIIRRHDEYVAIVGDQEVHVGDQIDGFTVIAIGADGVRVAKELSP
jgi:hypothetical protein